MKRALTFKSLFVALTLFSLFAFLFVNVRAGQLPSGPAGAVELTQNQLDGAESAEEKESIHVASVTVIGRIYELAQRFLGTAP